jgi:hypothetical protein
LNVPSELRFWRLRVDSGLSRSLDDVSVLGGPVLNLFRQRVLHGGMHPQLAYFVSDAKAELFESLKQTAPDWYQSDSIWQQFPNAATFLEPEAMQRIASSPHFTTSVLKECGHLSPLVTS